MLLFGFYSFLYSYLFSQISIVGFEVINLDRQIPLYLEFNQLDLLAMVHQGTDLKIADIFWVKSLFFQFY
jgi:hypothetical protein